MTVPLVASWRPFSIRISVDLPEPDSPITTKISPVFTSNEASMTAAVPSDETESRVAPAFSRFTISAGLRPNTL